MNVNAPITWDRIYEVGIASVDSEHRMLFNSYNTFIRAQINCHSRIAAGYALSFLEDYLNYHFSNEEYLMAGSGYDRYEIHRLEHKRLKIEFERLKSQFVCDDNINDQLLMLFRDWVLRHVVDEDRDIGVYLRCQERYSKQSDLAKPNNIQQTNQIGPIHKIMPPLNDIMNRNGRTSQRHFVNIPGNVVTKFMCENHVIVTNISQGGARISGITSLFKEAPGILTIPSLSLPDLSFIVKTAIGDSCSVYFTISLEKQDQLNRVLRSDKFTKCCVVQCDLSDNQTTEGISSSVTDAADMNGNA